MNSLERFLPDEAATATAAARLAACIPAGGVLYLHGGLGAGKTALVRGFLRARGFQGAVRSPTYTLVEQYEVEGRRLFHLDLYRLRSPEEVLHLGLEELNLAQDLLFVEWPEQGAGFLPMADMTCKLAVAGEGRRLHLQAQGARGVGWLTEFEQACRAGTSATTT